MTTTQNNPLIAHFHRQKLAFEGEKYPSLEERKQRLKALKDALLLYQDELCEAASKDFGAKHHYETRLTDILPCIQQINYTNKRLKKWMKPRRRHAGLVLALSQVRVQTQPLGVVGIIAPWNFPVFLSIGPLITALAAGNRAMIKVSEYTPRTNQVLIKMLRSIFSAELVHIVEGDAQVAAQFSSLPFDHLLFTGSTEVGRKVMQSAAPNLTPVTLELGGKSPVVIGPDMTMDDAAERLVYGKTLNSGQICVSPDYVLIPEGKAKEFVKAYKHHFSYLYPSGVNCDAYTSVISQSHFERIQRWLDEAEQGGAWIEPANKYSIDSSQRKMVTQLVMDAPEDSQLMQNEIFGPVLPIVAYKNLDEAIKYINQRPKPLALYVFSHEKLTVETVLEKTHSGGACVNDTILHVVAEDAPFGGVGSSGMGQYHGEEGYLTFSNQRTVVARKKLYPTRMIHPPFRSIHQLVCKWLLR
ncbi:aldehyde dehydrogenase [Vibrio nigripulchritudo]|uniref:coniferyl aldehyde dehydrogenase n=1 Tax=Vibrio nigripulchritudo TaxID=28173 RepID=UPI0019092274|nr:coniferyl aldehyde dehydrogenase [Vibrio nigripulchritudo]BCL71565.1 aldehyde dehydrogenase [Vibrio nigripulchritudo]BDU32922.1 aldehyde dehydrogenase [Vibrio nigripulchritudo]